MKIYRTPQEKKRLSYLRDGRNDYGENDKASRKAIPYRKRWVNKTYRKAVKQTIVKNISFLHADPHRVDTAVQEVKRKPWKKSTDKRLGEYLKDKAAFKQKYGLSKNKGDLYYQDGSLRDIYVLATTKVNQASYFLDESMAKRLFTHLNFTINHTELQVLSNDSISKS